MNRVVPPLAPLAIGLAAGPEPAREHDALPTHKP